MFLIELLKQSRSYQILLRSLQQGETNKNITLPRSARLPILIALHQDLNHPILFVTDRADRSLSLYEELTFWHPEGEKHHFPEPNPLFYEQSGWDITTRKDRLETLVSLLNYHIPGSEKLQHPFIITSIRAIMTRTLPKRDFIKFTRKYQIGSTVLINSIIRSWIDIGYSPADSVTEAGQFSHRGGLLDIWVPGSILPNRIEFFGDSIETIRSFNPATQRTVQNQNEIIITPAREILPVRARDSGLEDISMSEFYIPVAHPTLSCLLDFLPPKTLIALDDLDMLRQTASEIEEQAVKDRQESIYEKNLPDTFPFPYLSMAEVEDELAVHTKLQIRSTDGEAIDEDRLKFHAGERFAGRLKPFIEHLVHLSKRNDKVVIVSRQIERLQELWRAQTLSTDQFVTEPIMIAGSLSDGWIFQASPELQIHLITDGEIFGWEHPRSRVRHLPISETPEAAYADLKPGDWVVHIDHGIGQYAGMIQKTIDGVEGEYLTIIYQDGDQLFVPIYQADRLTRYIGTDNQTPSVTRLSSSDWLQTKQRVREAVTQVAHELLELYAKRQSVQGFSFSKDTAWQKEMEDSFPYFETRDQTKAIREVKDDMEKNRPMDRLLCGDVGYGKTEVALRAAFKAIMDGKQVAILVPTTVLAQQHYETFSQRLAAYPVQVEMLSRFKTAKEQEEIILQLLVGTTDIVIGTHRLLQPDIQFKDLGLVIIDEEQRFGVTHKESLKKIRLEVDVLTLTATPIPRTLYMALTGVRDISTINTPPDERLPIITHIGPYSPRLIRQAVLRELERRGQVFFVHNRVQTIPAMAVHLHNLIPEARIGIAHGQLTEENLSRTMHKFTHQEIDILLCTSIIESGLDIPNANTLIVDRADAFGLAQLYQLRGRVGRGAERAYAYFFRHKNRPPTLEGQERLDVIAENSQLGAGYSIAMRDLEMRGAGELLGTRQHGYIASVGFHLYTRLLAQAVNLQRPVTGDLKTNILTSRMPLAVNVDLPLNIGIPTSFLPDQNLRLRLYRRLADVQFINEIEPLKSEFKDRFGKLPSEVMNLFYLIQIKLLAEKAGLASIGIEGRQMVLRYPTKKSEKKAPILPPLGEDIRSGKNAYWILIREGMSWKKILINTLNRIIEVNK